MARAVRTGKTRAARDFLRHEAGFTLLEMLVAVAVLALLVSIVPRSLVFARSIIDNSQDWIGARLVAESVLNDVLVGPGVQAGVKTGEIEGRRWRATLRRHTGLQPTMLESGRMLFAVEIEVDVSAGQSLRVDTLRIGGPQ